MYGDGKKTINLFEETGRTIAGDIKEKLLKYDAIYKNVNTARSVIRSAIYSYKKRALNAKNKNEVNNLSKFDCLNDYQRRSEIVESWGMAAFEEDEYDRLLALWDEREEMEQKRTNAGGYFDEVVQLLSQAECFVGNEYEEFFNECDQLMQQVKQDIKRLLRF